MNSPVRELIRRLEDRDIRLQVINDRLRVDAPKGALTPELREQLHAHKPELISALMNDWAADARKLIAAVPDTAVRPALITFFDETVSLMTQHGRSRDEAEQQAFGLLLFQILRCGLDVEVAQ